MSGRRGRDAAMLCGIVFAVLLLQWPLRRIGMSLLDEGAILQMGADIVAGRRPYVDGVHYAFPAVFYITAAAFRVFGVSFEVARGLAVGLFAVLCMLGYLCARWWHGPRTALGMVVVLLIYRAWSYPHWQMWSYSTLAVVAGLAATWLLGMAAAGVRLLPFAGVGMLAAFTVLAKQDAGGMLVLALGTAVLVWRPIAPRSRVATVAAYVTGGVLVGVVAAVAAWRADILPAFVSEAILGPLYGSPTFTYLSRPPLWPLFQQDPTLRHNVFAFVPTLLLETVFGSLFESRMVQQTAVPDAALKLVFHLPWLVLAPAAWCLWRDRGPRLSRQRAGLLWLVCVANLLAFSRPHDWVHLIVLYVPTLLLLDWLGTRVAQRGVRAVRYVAVCVVGATGMVTAMLVWQLATANAFRLQTERGTIRVRAGDAAVMTDLLQALALAAPVGTPMLSLPYHPLVDFLANRPGVSRYYMVWPVEHDPNRDERIIESLEAAPTAPVTYALGQVPYFPPLETFAPRLTAYLADRYEVAGSFGGGFGQMGFLLLRRAAPRAGRELGLVRPLPREVWPGGRVWRVDPGIDQDAALVGPLTPLAGDRVSTACGPPPTTWGQPTMPVIDCEMVVRHAQGESTVAKVEIDPFHRRADRRYTSLEAGLDAWQGQSVTVILRVRQLVAPHQLAVPVGWLPVWLAPSS